MSKPKNILVADDSPRDAMLLQTAFEAARLPHRLYHVCYGLQVVSYLNAEPPFSSRDQFPFPHLLILDFQMPRVYAVVVLGFLRQRPEIQMPAVILFGS